MERQEETEGGKKKKKLDDSMILGDIRTHEDAHLTSQLGSVLCCTIPVHLA